MATAMEVIQGAGAKLNDFGLRHWNKERLFEHLLEAHKELQVKLLLLGIPVIKKTSEIITVPIGDTDIEATQPTDLVEPISVWERLAGSSDEFSQMKEKGWEPEQSQQSDLRYWIWQGELIKFLGATTDREIKIKYKASIEVPTQEGDPIGFKFGENYLVPKTAAYAALSLGNAKAYEILSGIAESKVDEVLRMNIKGQQSLPARRRPYRHGRKFRY